MSLGAARVKEDPECVADQAAYIRDGAECSDWAVHVKVEPADESGDCPPPDNADTLCTAPCGGYCRRGALRDHAYAKTDFPLTDECVKLESSLDSERAELYAEHAVKDELVLGPERVQRRAPAAASERFNPHECSPVAGVALVAGPEPARQPRGEQLALKKCSVRLERVPHRGPPARARGSDRAHTDGDSDIEHEIYTTVDYEKDPICELCGTRFPLKSDLMKHVVVHIHMPTSAQQEGSGAADDDLEKEKRRGHLESDDLPRYLWSWARLAPRDCRVRLERCAAPCGATAREPAPASQPPRGHDAAPPHPHAGTLPHAANTYVCDMCGGTLRRKHNLIQHIKMHMEHYESPNISKVVHKRIHSANRPYSCECKKEFTILKDLLIHIRIRKGRKLYSCAICKKRFPGKADLERHRRVHTGIKLFSCEICKREFSQLGSLKRHKVSLHAVCNIRVSCEVCNNRFADSLSLKIHKRIHTGEKPYSCEVCKKMFTQLGDLKAHRRIHTGEKPYICEICKKRFRRLTDLYRHKPIHTGEKPHCCEICGKKFRRLYCLKEHIRIHTGEQPYCCEICSDLFATSWALKSHKRIHGRRTQHETTKRGRSRKSCTPRKREACEKDNVNREDVNDDTNRKNVNDDININDEVTRERRMGADRLQFVVGTTKGKEQANDETNSHGDGR